MVCWFIVLAASLADEIVSETVSLVKQYVESDASVNQLIQALICEM